MATAPDDAGRQAFEAWYRSILDAAGLGAIGHFRQDPDAEYRFERVRSAYTAWDAALAHERAKTAWRPIETAPKNGDPILIGCDRTQSIRWAVWSEGFWRDGQASVGGRIAGVPSPSHWRPLPEPPT